VEKLKVNFNKNYDEKKILRQAIDGEIADDLPFV
jgi:hypothetical protein